MNISLSEARKSFVDDQVSSRGYSTSSEYVREPIRKDRDRQRLRGLLLEGAKSPYLVFHVEGKAEIDVWRVLHGARGIPARMREPQED